jgi:translation initiation factor IF-2
MGPVKNEGAPDAADTDPGGNLGPGAGAAGEATSVDGLAFLPPNLPNRDAVADVLRGLTGGEDAPWAPTPEFSPDSAGAEFAVYQARHAPAAGRDAPAPAASVILNVTQPMPVVRGARPAEVTQVDLSTLVERGQALEEAAAASTERARRRAPTMIVRTTAGDPARRARGALLPLAGAALLGGAAVLAGVLLLGRGRAGGLDAAARTGAPVEATARAAALPARPADAPATANVAPTSVVVASAGPATPMVATATGAATPAATASASASAATPVATATATATGAAPPAATATATAGVAGGTGLAPPPGAGTPTVARPSPHPRVLTPAAQPTGATPRPSLVQEKFE